MESNERNKISNTVLLWFLFPMLLVVLVGTTVLIYQCKRLYILLRKNEPKIPITHGKTKKTKKKCDTAMDDESQRIQFMDDMKRQARVSAQTTKAHLQEELRAVSQMQVEVSSQLILLKQMLGHWREQEQKIGTCSHDITSASSTLNHDLEVVHHDEKEDHSPDKKKD